MINYLPMVSRLRSSPRFCIVTSLYCLPPATHVRSHQADAAHKLVSKLNPGLGNKYEKAKMMRDIQGAKNVTTVTGIALVALCVNSIR